MIHRARRSAIAIAALAALAVAGCRGSESGGDASGTSTTSAEGAGSAPPVTTLDPAATTTAPPATAPPTVPDTTTPATTPDEVTDDDLVRFVAATESAVVGTRFEGAINDAAEIYIGLAVTACARFTAGEGFDAVAADLVTQLSAPDPTDVERLVGAILGAATRTICPEHADLV